MSFDAYHALPPKKSMVGGLNPHWFPSDSSVGAPPCRYDMHVTRLAEDVLAPGQAPMSFQHLPWRHLRCLRASSMNLAGLDRIPIISFLMSNRHLTHLLMRQPTPEAVSKLTAKGFLSYVYCSYCFERSRNQCFEDADIQIMQGDTHEGGHYLAEKWW